MSHDITGYRTTPGLPTELGTKRFLDTFNTGTGIRIAMWNQRGNVIDAMTITPESARQLAADLETLADIIEKEAESPAHEYGEYCECPECVGGRDD